MEHPWGYTLDMGRAQRDIRKAEHSLFHRLHSIDLDSKYVTSVRIHFSDYPVLGNLRCGTWYQPSFTDTCYFKSSDGHYRKYDFSVSRLNLHVAFHAFSKRGVLIVDSTQKGKRYPDSFSKSIPMWCSIMNYLIYYHGGLDTEKKEEWDGLLERCGRVGDEEEEDIERRRWKPSDFLWLPGWVPPTEESMITDKLPLFVKKSLDHGVDVSDLARHADSPLRCIWTHQGVNHEKLNLKDRFPFVPVICCSASDPDHPKRSTSFTYIQGAADDPESWAHGLTPELFWTHHDELLGDSVICESVAASITRSQKLGFMDISSSQSHEHPCSCWTVIGNTKIAVGRIDTFHPDHSEGVAAVVIIHPVGPLGSVDEMQTKMTIPCLRIPMKQTLKDKNSLQVHMHDVQDLFEKVYKSLSLKKVFLIVCENGLNASCAAALALLSMFYDENGMPKSRLTMRSS
eukprot:TRINITY_DN868_c0_g1_i8.p1 TRINITY_DN868_c0_g1~~TRINITY_DN868_c0_g1_i8.p1  ORF type:complete len:472 (-),score=116.37 TRINITY_DN868_c0_g1_i8:1929-3296(-)